MGPTMDKTSRYTRLDALLRAIWAGNNFYKTKWLAAGLTPSGIASMDDLTRYPSLRRADMRADQETHPPFGTNLTYDHLAFTRLHRSSGTTGHPLRWLDDEVSWKMLLHCSASAYRMAGIVPSDRLFLSARFGTSLGPWLLRAGAHKLGCLGIAPGDIPLVQELHLLRDLSPTVLVGKPSKLIALAQSAKAAGQKPERFGVRKLITVCEPGGSNQDVRSRIESEWAAESFDRYGMTEAGTVAAECVGHPGGLHILEDDLIAEVLHPDADTPMPEGVSGELVLTHLTRYGQPIVRYRTGDCACLNAVPLCNCGLRSSLLIASLGRLS